MAVPRFSLSQRTLESKSYGGWSLSGYTCLSVRIGISSRVSFVCLGAAVYFVSGLVGLAAPAESLILQPAGSPRPLHAPVFGASTATFYEHLLDNPAKIAMLKTMAIGLDRFPGGSVANFYNWHTGLFEVPTYPNSSRYMQFWAGAAANIAREMPQGITLERYDDFSRQIGAQVILVPNFESSSVAEQVKWFERLSHAGAVPERIELGNEYWVAMGNDPRSLARWRDEPASVRIMQEYVTALKPYFPPHVKLAIQAAAGALDIRGGRFGQRLQQWDEDLRPEPWFDAVTLHLYPRLRDVMGDAGAGQTPPTPQNALPRLTAMTARVDEGIEHIIQTTEQHLPGKEIWITEWSPRGADTATERGGAEPMSPAMEMLTAARMALVYLRHPSVTAALFFMYSFNERDPHAMFVADGQGGFAPLPAAAALRWLNEAANAGGSFQRLLQAGARPISGGGARQESYLPIEGGLFRTEGRTTLILENVSGDTFSLDPVKLMPNRQPAKVEFISMPNLADAIKLPAKIDSRATSGPVTVTPFSVTRITWN